ncbi:MAG: hypothetical protein ACRENE_33715 [Polyangiaceae bacterium]
MGERRAGVAAIALTCAMAVSAPGAAAADDPPASAPASEPRHFGSQRSLGFGPIVGLDVLGAAVGAQLDVVGLWITGGYAPVFVFGNRYDELRTFTADYYGSGQVGADVTLMLLHPTPKLDAGLLLGYRYNSVLAHGIGFGAIAVLDFTPSLAGFLLVEPEVFPDAQSQINAAGYPSDRQASLPALQGGASVGLLVYP